MALLPATALGQSKPVTPKDATKSVPRDDKKAEPAKQLPKPAEVKPADADANAAQEDYLQRPLKVRICQAIEREVTDYEDLAASVEPIQVVQIRARATGYLLNVMSRPGQVVQQGDTLFQIDSRSYRLELDKAEAELRRAQSRAKPLSIQLAQARDAGQGTTAAKLEGELEEARAAIQSAKAVRDLAQLNLEYTKVTAPFTGKISAPEVSPGDVVVADKTELATLTKTDPLSVLFTVSEATFLRLNRMKREGKVKSGLERGLSVDVVFAGDENLKLKGTVHSVAGEVTPLAGGIKCAALIPNADGALLPGLSASVHLVTSEPHRSVLVPRTAIPSTPRTGDGSGPDITPLFPIYGRDPLTSNVLVVTDRNTLELREVRIGLEYHDFQVVTKGLKAGEWLVIDPEPLRPYSLRTVKIRFERISPPGTGTTAERKGPAR